MSYYKGSEWRRWEFHLHTPGTLKGDEYKGKDQEEKWNNFYSDIINYISDSNDPLKSIAAIGITDYLSIENYKKVISDNILKDKIPFIFPNIELRLTLSGKKSPVNIHCMFNPKIMSEIEDCFLNKLIKNYKGIDYSATTRDLIRFGKAMDGTLDEVKALKFAKEQFPISFDSLKDALKNQIIRDNCIVVVSGKSYDGLSGITAQNGYYDETTGISQLLATREDITYFADAIFSAAPSDIDYFSGLKEPIKVVKDKYRSLKPCLIGCDAHCNDKIFEPDNKKYCWIKADPSFNGLKQILFEPTERVKLSELRPYPKKDYYVIEKVIFNDDNFTNEPIYFNEGLTCIIGGKSTGKSILLNNMASKIDYKQVENKINEVNRNNKRHYIKNLEVYWRDGEESETDLGKERKIVYIPQSYLNRLSDDDSEKTEIDDIIQEIILQNLDAKKIYDEVYYEITETKSKIDKKIYDLLLINKKINEISKNLKENGKSKDIEKSLIGIKQQKENLLKTISISETDMQDYDKAINRTRHNKSIITINSKNVEELESIESLLIPRHIDFDFIELIKMSIDAEAIKERILIDKEWKLKKKELIISVIENNVKIQESIDADKIVIEKIQPQIERNEAISILTKQIQHDEELIDKAKLLEKKLEDQFKIYNNLIDDIINLTIGFKTIHEKYADYIKDNPDFAIDDMLFQVKVPLRKEKYFTRLQEIFFKSTLKSIISSDELIENDYDFNFIKLMINTILEGQGDILKKGYDIEEALRAIASDWFNVTYTIDMEGDTINEMSPGKKALVLLKLLISLAESNCPILIDQPEDDLDNRSIYKELVEFIKKKKKDRQIILVTHNANIVLGCDAEEIIIANQEGINAENNSKRFEYRSGSIENIEIIYENKKIKKGILNSKGIKEQICEILEGGPEAFKIREQKYIL